MERSRGGFKGAFFLPYPELVFPATIPYSPLINQTTQTSNPTPSGSLIYHNADAIIVAVHLQGSVVSTHLLDRLIKDGHIVTSQNQVQTRKEDQKDLVMPVGFVV